jgi:hypothetical protein
VTCPTMAVSIVAEVGANDRKHHRIMRSAMQ